MSDSSLEKCLDEVIIKLNSRSISPCIKGLTEFNELLHDLCVLAKTTHQKSHHHHYSNSGSRSRTSTFKQHHRHASSVISTASSSAESSNESPLYSPSNSPMSQISSMSSSPSSGTESSGIPGTRKWRIPQENDPVFGEFIRLQNNFQYNMASQLALLLHHLWNLYKSSKTHSKELNECIVLLLKDLQGCLLLHPPSRKIFEARYNIGLLLEILDYNVGNDILTNCIPVLVSCMVRNVKVIRLFEELHGPMIICKLLKSKAEQDNTTPSSSVGDVKEVEVKILEFLFFYLIPEIKTKDTNKEKDVIVGPDGVLRRTLDSKIRILNKYLNEEVTQNLVKELLSSKPFGEMNISW